jgi:hypothetical protein
MQGPKKSENKAKKLWDFTRKAWYSCFARRQPVLMGILDGPLTTVVRPANARSGAKSEPLFQGE